MFHLSDGFPLIGQGAIVVPIAHFPEQINGREFGVEVFFHLGTWFH